MQSIDPTARVLVTGAAGFIGFHLSRALLAAGVSVTGFDNLNDYYDPALKQARLAELAKYPAFTFVRGDLADADAVSALFGAEGFPYVVNLAAQAGVRYSIENPGAYVSSNLVGFCNLLEALRAHPPKHFVYASSSSVYGNRKNVPFSTDDPVDRPISLYAATKKSNELLAYTYTHLYGIPSTGLRFFTVYGPWGRPDMAYFSFTKRILAGEPIRVFNAGNLSRDFTYIDDIVTGVTRVLYQPPAPNSDGDRAALYNIGNQHPEKLGDFIGTLETLLGKQAVKVYLPMQPGDVTTTAADTAPLARDFGFSPDTKLSDGLAQFVRWYRAYYKV